MINSNILYTWTCMLCDYKHGLGKSRNLTSEQLLTWYGNSWYEIYRDDNIILLLNNYDMAYISVVSKKRIHYIPKKFHEMLQLRLDLHRIK